MARWLPIGMASVNTELAMGEAQGRAQMMQVI